MIKKTSIYDKHVELGARMVEFGGWMMPVSYSSIIDEHKTVRESVGIFDVSHMGEFWVTGKDSLKFLEKLVPQSIESLIDSKAVYCQLLNTNGGIIDDLIIYKIAEEKYLAVVNASRIEEDYNWMVQNLNGFDVSIDNQSDNYSMFAIQGPKAVDLLAKLGLSKENQPNTFFIKEANLVGLDLIIARTGYTGEDGFEIMVKNDSAIFLWDELLKAGDEFGLKPIGLGARDTLRLEAAFPLYGNDLDENTTPVEAGLTWSISKNKNADYNGKAVVQNQLQNCGRKKLIGLKMLDKSIPRHEYEIFYNNEEVGHVTSGGVSPILSENIALGYVKNIEDICIDNIVQVKIREKLHDAVIVKRPFVQKNSKA